MHTGDGHIDVWLATTVPLVAALLLTRRRWLAVPAMMCVFAGALYTLLATQSRGPVFALAFALVVGIIALLAISAKRGIAAALLLIVVGAMTTAAASAVSLTNIPFVQRFAGIGPDALVRVNHWQRSLALRDESITSEIFGMGLGSFPLLHQLRARAEPRSGRYMFTRSGSETFLRMWSGENLYMGQSVPLLPNGDYRISMRARSLEPDATVTFVACELWLLTSQNCTGTGFHLQPSPSRWTEYSGSFHTSDTGTPKKLAGMTFAPPTRLTFFVSQAAKAGVDVAYISLKDPRGRELIRNGSFADGADHWFWTEDNHLAWHVKNLAVAVLLEQGWLGIAALGALLGYVYMTLIRQLARRDPMSPIFAASMTGFAVTAITVSSFDAPRLTLMFYLICFVIVSGSRPSVLLPRPKGKAPAAS
jgi:hypothetical protein